MASIFKIRDENGQIIEIPAFRGKQGEPGIQGDKGEDGVGIQSIEKTNTDGLVDTYTITMTDGSTNEFTVTNGANVTLADPTLTMEGTAADAKATGDRLGAIEYQTVVTDVAYEHKDLPEIEKNVAFELDGTWGDTAYINYGVDLLPRGGFHKAFPWNGVTITQKGDTYKLSGLATANATLMFTKDGSNNYYIELPDGLIGKTLTFLGFTNSLLNDVSVSIFFYDAEKTQILKKSHNLAQASTILNYGLEVPEGAVYYAVQIYIKPSAGELNHETKLFLVLADELEEISLLESIIKENVTNTSFSTLPYKSSLSYKVTLSEYISNFAGGGTVTYLTPEDFGALADGATDDSEAIAECLEQASVLKQTVLMAKKYYITAPIEIKQNGLNIIANDIVYDGTDTAIKISGQNNTLKVHQITSGGIGISYRADGGKIVKHNDVDINTINTVSHGIVFYNGLKGIYQNTVKFNYIKAGGAGCYGICMLDTEGSSWVTENNFYGGQIANCEWAIYKIGGNSKLYGIQVEENVQGGFYIENGGANIFHPRIAEGMRDGTLPIFKFVGVPRYTTIYDTSGIYINQIDLSEAEETFVAEDSGVTHPLEEHMICTINAPIFGSNIEDGNNAISGNIYSYRTYVWGKYLIMTPHMTFKKTVDSEILDTRLIGTETESVEVRKLPQLPTKFIINTIDSEIHLHASYCPFGFNEFEVEQSNGYTCKIYDVKGRLIFDGTDRGNGVYKLKVYKNEYEKAGIYFGALEYTYDGCFWQITEENNDTQARDRLDNIEYEITTTEPTNEHKDLLEKSKDLVIDTQPIWGDDVYINYGIDLIPRGGMRRESPWGGVTIVKNGDVYEFSGQVTASSFINDFVDSNSVGSYNTLPEGLSGKQLYLIRFTDSLVSNLHIIVTFFDADKTQLTKFTQGLTPGALNGINVLTVPEGSVYYTVGFYSKTTDFEYNHKTKVYLLVQNEFEKLTLSNGSAVRKNISATSFSTLPYESYIKYKEKRDFITKNDLIVKENDNGNFSLVIGGV